MRDFRLLTAAARYSLLRGAAPTFSHLHVWQDRDGPGGVRLEYYCASYWHCPVVGVSHNQATHRTRPFTEGRPGEAAWQYWRQRRTAIGELSVRRVSDHENSMKARDWFGLIIRVIGILLLLYSVWYLAWAVRSIFASGDFITYLVHGVPCLVLGAVFVGFARGIVRFSYPDDKDDSDA